MLRECQTTATTMWAFASPAHGRGPKRGVYGRRASAEALTIAPVRFPGDSGDEHAPPGGCQ